MDNLNFYTFSIEVISTGKGYVYAESLEEAKKKLKNHEWDDIYDTVDTEYGDIIEIYLNK